MRGTGKMGKEDREASQATGGPIGLVGTLAACRGGVDSGWGLTVFWGVGECQPRAAGSKDLELLQEVGQT